jgi:hypothetical protein
MDICLGSFATGSFTATLIFTGHSALDTYMLLVEGPWKRLLDIGDFGRRDRTQQRTADTVRDGSTGKR